MQDHRSILEAFTAWQDAPLALATVVTTWGSAPRPRGSHMLVRGDGRFEGSVSGGCVEGDVLALAEEVMTTGFVRRRSYGVSNGSAWEVGLPCGGEIDVMVQPVGDNGFPRQLGREIDEALRAGRPVSVSTDLSDGISFLGERAADGIFVNRYLPPRRMFIIGAVQIAQSLVAIGRTLGLHPVVIDPRSRYLTRERFPDAILDDRWPDEALAVWRPDGSSAVITLSHDPKIDDPALVAALGMPTGYIAALGSTRSHAARLDRLSQAGLPPEALLRIEGPAGLRIGAMGAAEIALSIAAGMVATFAKVQP